MFNFFKRNKPVRMAIKVNVTRHELRERKWERMQRRTLRWGVLRHYILRDELSKVKNLYEVKKVCRDWKYMRDIINNINDFKLNNHDFDVLHRFVRMKQFKGLCDIENVSNITLHAYQESEHLNIESYLLDVYDNFESYWDNVLDDYVKPSFKRKRLEYLLENLNKELTDSTIEADNVRGRIKQLIIKYQRLLDSTK